MHHFLFKIILFLFSIYLFVKFRSFISLKLCLIDHPNERKKHSKPTPLIGGLIFFTLISEYVIYDFFTEKNTVDFKIFFLASIIFFIGLMDDIKNINPLIRLFLIFSIFFTFFQLFPEYSVKKLNFNSLDKEVFLGNFSLFFSALCLALLLNAFNMTDGINGLFLGLSIISFSYIYISYEINNFYYLFWIIVILFILFFLNQLNLFFMGDSGVYLISTILGIFIMSAYNSKFSNIKSVEEIFLLLCIPGIDMFRLFITRLLNKKNPFKPDRNHFHHLLQLKFNNNWTICTYFSLTLIPLLLQYIDINIIYSIFILIAIYLYLIWYLKRI